MAFDGFPVAALDFYDDLELDNSKSFWEANKPIYLEAVKAPMVALTEALAPVFGEAKIFRPHRDVRFSKNKTPFKTHQGAYISTGPATGWYIEISAAGVRAGFGFYDATSERLAAVREAIDDDKTGPALVRIINRLGREGFEIGGDKLKTSPRNYAIDHPRIELLRHKQLIATKSYGFEPLIHSPELLERVRADWDAGRPLLKWLAKAS